MHDHDHAMDLHRKSCGNLANHHARNTSIIFILYINDRIQDHMHMMLEFLTHVCIVHGQSATCILIVQQV